MKVSTRLGKLPLSATLALDARAKALAAAGRDVVNMSVGEPDFPAPAAVREAASAKALGGDVRYTLAGGTLSLREAISAHLESTRGARYSPDEIAVCQSAKHALSGALHALVDPGDEVLVSLPYWVSYVELVRLAGGVACEAAPAPGCRPNVKGLRERITPRTRGILLNSPCNPSGVVWSEAELRELVALAAEHDLWILSDEIYRRLSYGKPAPSLASLGPAARERSLIIDGASKAFAMTGYRIGYLAGPRPVIEAVARYHSQMTGSPNAISQAAFEVALRREPPEVAAMAAEFQTRRDLLVAGLRALGLETPAPEGAFYAFPNVSAFLDARGSAGFCSDLLEEQGLSLVPGSAFGLDGHVRLSYALSAERLRDALRRLDTFLAPKRAAGARR